MKSHRQLSAAAALLKLEELSEVVTEGADHLENVIEKYGGTERSSQREEIASWTSPEGKRRLKSVANTWRVPISAAVRFLLADAMARWEFNARGVVVGSDYQYLRRASDVNRPYQTKYEAEKNARSRTSSRFRDLGGRNVGGNDTPQPLRVHQPGDQVPDPEHEGSV